METWPPLHLPESQEYTLYIGQVCARKAARTNEATHMIISGFHPSESNMVQARFVYDYLPGAERISLMTLDVSLADLVPTQLTWGIELMKAAITNQALLGTAHPPHLEEIFPEGMQLSQNYRREN